jgi:hypothetical protein
MQAAVWQLLSDSHSSCYCCSCVCITAAPRQGACGSSNKTGRLNAKLVPLQSEACQQLQREHSVCMPSSSAAGSSTALLRLRDNDTHHHAVCTKQDGLPISVTTQAQNCCQQTEPWYEAQRMTLEAVPDISLTNILRGTAAQDCYGESDGARSKVCQQLIVTAAQRLKLSCNLLTAKEGHSEHCGIGGSTSCRTVRPSVSIF